ncbi:MAG: IS66 family transposase [Cyanobium sp.]
MSQEQENAELRNHLTALATELAQLRERIGRSSRNSSKPPSSDGPGFKPSERRKGSGRKRGGQPGHPGSGPELLSIERVDAVVEHHPEACRRCGMVLEGDDPEPLRHQLIEIPPITPLVIEHRLHRLVCPCCSTRTCAPLPADVEPSHYGPRLSALVGLLSSAFPLSVSKIQALLDPLLGIEISRGAIARIRQRLSNVLAQPMAEVLQAARQQPVAYVVDEVLRAAVETGAPTGNADGNNPTGKRGWQWVMVTPMATVFLQGLSRSAAAAIELLGSSFGGIVVSDRFSAYNHLPLEQRQLCWAHLIRDLRAMAERSGASAEVGDQLIDLQQQLFVHWHRYKDGLIDWPGLQHNSRSIREAFVATLQRVVDLGFQRGERTPWASTVRTCRELLQRSNALWTFLTIEGIEPTNNAAERALRPSVIQRRISHGVQSRQGAICRSRLLTVTTTLRQQGRDVWQFLEQAWVAYHRGGLMPSLLPAA